MRINGQEVGGDRIWVCAEIGHNHGGSVETAKQMIRAAAQAGADAVKFQVRSNRDIYTAAAYNAPYASENAYGPTYGEHREALELAPVTLAHLKWFADRENITLFATAFDPASVDLCVELGFPALKIASGDLTNTPLIAHAAATGLPLIISTGGATWTDIDRAMRYIPHNTQVGLLQCTAAYPCDYDELDLEVIPQFEEAFGDSVVPGISMHTNGIAMAPVAYTLGARIIEMHMTLDRTSKGTDHSFSLEPQGFRKLVRDLRRVEMALGACKRVHDSELAPITKMRKVLRAARALPSGHVLVAADMAIKSPADDYGLAPYNLDDVVGRRLTTALDVDDLIPRSILHEPALLVEHHSQ